jgi:hypothetical protein
MIYATKRVGLDKRIWLRRAVNVNGFRMTVGECCAWPKKLSWKDEIAFILSK